MLQVMATETPAQDEVDPGFSSRGVEVNQGRGYKRWEKVIKMTKKILIGCPDLLQLD